MKLVISAFILVIFQFACFSQDKPFNEELIKQTFVDVRAICEKDNGQLWGKNLWGPIMVVDRDTRMIFANHQDSAGNLIKKGEIYYGTYPDNQIISNSSIALWGTSWAIISYLPMDSFTRNSLFLHESFHRLQLALGLKSNGYENNHIGELMARTLLKLEWSALESAVKDDDANFKKDIHNALIFRNYRRHLFSGSNDMENKFEIHEGLPEYTAVKLCSSSEQDFQMHLLEKHDEYWNKESLVRTFGYYSGFLYSYLLDKTNINWRKDITSSTDLGSILADSLNLLMPIDLEKAFDSIKDFYGYSEIYNSELKSQAVKDSIRNSNYETFIKGPVLKIGLLEPNIGFNPNAMQPLDSIGMVYDQITITDKWGKLVVTSGGCLLSQDWKYALVPAIEVKNDNGSVTTASWSLFLNDGWKVRELGGQYFLKGK